MRNVNVLLNYNLRLLTLSNTFSKIGYHNIIISSA